MNEKNERDTKQTFEDEDETQKQTRTAEPGRTPGQAEGTEADVREALRRQEERKREH